MYAFEVKVRESPGPVLIGIVTGGMSDVSETSLSPTSPNASFVFHLSYNFWRSASGGFDLTALGQPTHPTHRSG